MSRTFAPAANAYLESPLSAVYNQLDGKTLCMWVKPSSLPPLDAGIASLMSKDPNDTESVEFAIDNATGDEGEFYANQYANADESVFGQSSTAPNTIIAGSWQHLAFTIRITAGGAPILYINGVASVPLTHGGLIPGGSTVFDDSGTPWTIGNGFTSFDPHYEGEISDVRIYNTVLTAGQVASVAAGSDPLPGNLVAWWKLCDADPFADSSGNANTLTDHNTSAGTSNPPVSICAATAYSVPDDRNYSVFPNDSRDVQGTETFDVPAHPSHDAPVDSRAAGASVDSRKDPNIPENSRTPE